MQIPAFLKKIDFWLAVGLGCVFLRGLFLDVMDVDASQYASISMEMWQGGHWLEVMHRHADYLDKPPLLFWLSATSMGLLGCSNFAYKLPSLLAALAGIFATYRFAKLYYSQKTARHAAFILASSLGLMLIANDVRTDTLLLGMTACAIWQLAEYQRSERVTQSHPHTFVGWKNLLAAFIFIGLAMLAKGPIGLVIPAFAVGSHLIFQRDWRGIFRWQWLVGLAVVALVLAPMCWGLYHQFDLHPEKPLHDRRTSSGLYFFFWEQSFGRVTGENVWHDDSSPLYFAHTYLWAFAPWSLLFMGALWARARAVFGQKFRLPSHEEGYSLGAFVLTFVALSMSNYKLPHYIFVTLPWAAVLTARWLGSKNFGSNEATKKVWNWVQLLVFVLITFLVFIAFSWVFVDAWSRFSSIVYGILLAVLWFLWRAKLPKTGGGDWFVRPGVVAAIGLGFALNFWFYPHLLPYQSTSQVGHFLEQNNIPAGQVGFFKRHGHALDFYAGGITQEMTSAKQIQETAARLGEFWLYTTEEGRAELERVGVGFEVAKAFPHFQAARLSFNFLNPATRLKSLEPTFLLKIEGRGSGKE